MLYGRGYGRGWGMGFGFRGSSPPWPYVGRGRGGLPRCGYFLSGAAGAPVAPPYWQAMPTGQMPYPPYGGAGGAPSYGGAAYGPTPFAPQMTREEELDFLKEEAGAVKRQLEEIESRMRGLEAKD